MFSVAPQYVSNETSLTDVGLGSSAHAAAVAVSGWDNPGFLPGINEGLRIDTLGHPLLPLLSFPSVSTQQGSSNWSTSISIQQSNLSHAVCFHSSENIRVDRFQSLLSKTATVCPLQSPLSNTISTNPLQSPLSRAISKPVSFGRYSAEQSQSQSFPIFTLQNNLSFHFSVLWAEQYVSQPTSTFIEQSNVSHFTSVSIEQSDIWASPLPVYTQKPLSCIPPAVSSGEQSQC